MFKPSARLKRLVLTKEGRVLIYILKDKQIGCDVHKTGLPEMSLIAHRNADCDWREPKFCSCQVALIPFLFKQRLLVINARTSLSVPIVTDEIAFHV